MNEYKFKIGAYTPKTIPMARLSEYLAAFAELLGEKGQVHFDHLLEGSTCVVARVDREAIPKTRLRLEEARTADADHPLYRPMRALNDLLRDDNAEGAITQGNIMVIKFPGRREVRPAVIGPFTKHTEIDGVLVRIGGRDQTAHAQLEDEEGRIWSCDIDRDMARRLAPYLFGQPVRIYGSGRWKRTPEETWELDRMKATDFKPLGKVSLGDAITEIRKVPVRLKAVTAE